MQSQFAIPSFNPSLSSSRKSQPQSPDDPTSAKLNFTKKLFEPQTAEIFNRSHQDPFQPRCGEQFWQALYPQLNSTYKTMMNKYTLLEESIKLHKQALTLRNSQYIDNEDRVNQLNAKIKTLSNKAKQNDDKIAALGGKCQQKKAQIESIRSKIHKEQSIIIEEEKHVDELEKRMLNMK